MITMIQDQYEKLYLCKRSEQLGNNLKIFQNIIKNKIPGDEYNSKDARSIWQKEQNIVQGS